MQIIKKKKKKKLIDSFLGGIFEFFGAVFKTVGALFFEGADGWAAFVRLLRAANKRKSRLAVAYNLSMDHAGTWQKFSIYTDDAKLAKLAKKASVGITRGLKAAQEELERMRKRRKYAWW